MRCQSEMLGDHKGAQPCSLNGRREDKISNVTMSGFEREKSAFQFRDGHEHKSLFLGTEYLYPADALRSWVMFQSMLLTLIQRFERESEKSADGFEREIPDQEQEIRRLRFAFCNFP